MYAAPPAIHALPPKPVFDHFSQHAHAPASASAISPRPQIDAVPASHSHHYSFCIQLSIAPVPRREDILFATKSAEANWLHPDGCPPEQQLPQKLPFYQNVVASLDALCEEIHTQHAGCAASVTVSDPPSPVENRASNHSFDTQRPKRDIVIGVWLGAPDVASISKLRTMFLSRCPVALVIVPEAARLIRRCIVHMLT